MILCYCTRVLKGWSSILRVFTWMQPSVEADIHGRYLSDYHRENCSHSIKIRTLRQCGNFDKEDFTFIPANFRYMKKYLRLNGVNNVDGILADLGISSHQIDVPERGFSTRYQAQLDMRMDQQSNQTAGDIINTYDETALQRVLGTYGEVKNARTLAAAIVQARDQNPIKTVDQLKQVIKPLAPRHREYKYFAQVFQALRIEVKR